MAGRTMPATHELATRTRMLRYLAAELGIRAQEAQSSTPSDPKVLAWVRTFQQRQGIAVTGRLDRATCTLLRQRAAERSGAKALPGHALPILFGLDEDERFHFYLRYLASVGDDARELWSELRASRRVILGLRVPTNTRSRQGRGVYDDRLIVLWHDGTGRCAEFEANTDPSSRYEDRYEHAAAGRVTTKDADGDDRGDLGRLPYGVYRFHKSVSQTHGHVLRPMEDITTERDTDHNGWFGSRDRVSRRQALSSGKSILFHRGGINITGSAACQTLRPNIFSAFFRTLGSQMEFYYLLVPAKVAWSKSVPPRLNLTGESVV